MGNSWDKRESVMYAERHKFQQCGIAKLLFFFVIRIILFQAGVVGKLVILFL